MKNELINAAYGKIESDILITNANIVNVFSGKISRGAIAVKDAHFVGVDFSNEGLGYKAKNIINIEGKYVCPGLVDSHVHIESSMLWINEFANAVVPCGTTTVIADPHEIVNVMGIGVFDILIDDAKVQPMNIFFTIPSCVPATNMETSNGKVSPNDVLKLIDKPYIVGLGELMNFPGVINSEPNFIEMIDIAERYGKIADGHAPLLSKKALQAYLCAGVSSDHECTSFSEAYEKLELGMKIMIREGTVAKNLKDLFPLAKRSDNNRVMWCTDDRHPNDILEKGHVDSIIREAILLGLDPVQAFKIGTLNAANHFGLKRLGAIAPGYQADFIIFDDLNDFRAEKVFHKGKPVAENGKILTESKTKNAALLFKAIKSDNNIDFSIPAKGQKIKVIGLLSQMLLTECLLMDAKIIDNFAVSDIERDIIKVAVIERYSGKNGMGKGFVHGFGLKYGAIASTVAHDSHNIIVAGANDLDMAFAVQILSEQGGGLIAVNNRKVLASLRLPIAGLMSDKSVFAVRDDLNRLLNATQELKICIPDRAYPKVGGAYEKRIEPVIKNKFFMTDSLRISNAPPTFGYALPDPFMNLSFIALPVIPALKITDKGLIDVNQFKIVSLF